jgi:hypothetical protein
MDDHLLVCQQFLSESHLVTRFANERASFLNMMTLTYNFLEHLIAIIFVVNQTLRHKFRMIDV